MRIIRNYLLSVIAAVILLSCANIAAEAAASAENILSSDLVFNAADYGENNVLTLSDGSRIVVNGGFEFVFESPDDYLAQIKISMLGLSENRHAVIFLNASQSGEDITYDNAPAVNLALGGGSIALDGCTHIDEAKAESFKDYVFYAKLKKGKNVIMVPSYDITNDCGTYAYTKDGSKCNSGVCFNTVTISAYASGLSNSVRFEAEDVNTNASKLSTDKTQVRIYDNKLTFVVNSDCEDFCSIRVATSDTYAEKRNITIELNGSRIFDGDTSSGYSRLDTYYGMLNEGENTISFLCSNSNDLFLDYIEIASCPVASVNDICSTKGFSAKPNGDAYVKGDDIGVKLYSDGAVFGIYCTDAGVYKLTARLGDNLSGARTITYSVNGEETTVSGIQIKPESGGNGYGYANFDYYVQLSEGLNTIEFNSNSSAVYLAEIELTPLQTVPTVQGQYLRIEAETLEGALKGSSDWNKAAAAVYNNGNGVTFTVYCTEEGEYTLTTFAGDNFTDSGNFTITINGVTESADSKKLIQYMFASYHNTINLSKGQNTINIKISRGNTFVDYFELSKSGRNYITDGNLCFGEPMLTAGRSIYGYTQGYYIKELNTLSEARDYALNSSEHCNKAVIAMPIYGTTTLDMHNLVAGVYEGASQEVLKNALVSSVRDLYFNANTSFYLQEVVIDITDAEYVKVFSLSDFEKLIPLRKSKMYSN